MQELEGTRVRSTPWSKAVCVHGATGASAVCDAVPVPACMPLLAPTQEFALCGDLFEDLKKGGGQMKEKYAARDVIVPFLSALSYLHAQVGIGRGRQGQGHAQVGMGRVRGTGTPGLAQAWAPARAP